MRNVGIRDDEIVQLTAFKVGNEEYVVDILRVREIIRPLQITPVRRGPAYVEGVICLRGSVIPVVDMRRRFGIAGESETPRQQRVIILLIEGRVLGLVVDSVTDVVRLPRKSIRPAPGLLASDRAPYFMGVCHYRERILILLNVKSIVQSEEEIEPLKTEKFVALGDGDQVEE